MNWNCTKLFYQQITLSFYKMSSSYIAYYKKIISFWKNIYKETSPKGNNINFSHYKPRKKLTLNIFLIKQHFNYSKFFEHANFSDTYLFHLHFDSAFYLLIYYTQWIIVSLICSILKDGHNVVTFSPLFFLFFHHLCTSLASWRNYYKLLLSNVVITVLR